MAVHNHKSAFAFSMHTHFYFLTLMEKSVLWVCKSEHDIKSNNCCPEVLTNPQSTMCCCAEEDDVVKQLAHEYSNFQKSYFL